MDLSKSCHPGVGRGGERGAAVPLLTGQQLLSL